MIDVIHIGLTGLQGYQRGLRVIANNTANLNTPGFKSSSLRFASLFYASDLAGWAGAGGYGFGLDTLGTSLDFGQGSLQSSSSPLDVAIDGQGMLVLRDPNGKLHYTRDGQLKFDANGVLVSATTGEPVMALGAGGVLGPIDVSALRTSAASPTTAISFQGNLSSTVATATVGGVSVVDRAGSKHSLSVRFNAVSGMPGVWDVTVLEGTTTVGTGRLTFVNGRPDPAAATIAVTYTVAGQAGIPVTLDFATNVTSYDTSTQSTLAMSKQDGYGPGALTSTTFETDGTLTLGYSNGQKVTGARLALAGFDSPDALVSAGNNLFEAADGTASRLGLAGSPGFGAVRAGQLELSNCDLAQEFSDLVVMQRGFQASSQVITTANEMIAELFGIRGK